MELHTYGVRPFHAMHPELRPEQRPPDRQIVLVRNTQHEEVGVPKEDQKTAHAQNPGRLGDPMVRVRPDGRTVLRDNKVEG
jgi:hypothetical protein